MGYDAVGNLRGYKFTVLADGAIPGYTQTYTYTYQAREQYLEKTVSGTSSDTNFKATTVTSYYDAAGRRIAVEEDTPKVATEHTMRYFSYDAEGHILTRRDGQIGTNGWYQPAKGGAYQPPGEPLTYPDNPIDERITETQWEAMSSTDRSTILELAQDQRFVYVNGQQVSQGTRAGNLSVTSGLTAYGDAGAGRMQVVAQEGDTLRSIALRVYGNSDLWYVIADANAMHADKDVTAGVEITVPSIKVNSNDASTFRPYNPGEIIGPTTPDMPYIAPPKPHCNAVMMILMVVVAVVVCVFAPELAPMLAPMFTGTAATAAAAFIVGTAASVGAQAIGSAVGATHFSWKQALIDGATAAVTAGVAESNLAGSIASKMGAGGSTMVRGAIAGVAGNVGSYAARRVIDPKNTHFSWKSVAASAVAGAISAKISSTLTSKIPDKNFRQFADGAIGGVVSLHTRRAFGMNDRVDYAAIAADAFGNALGNAYNARRSERAAYETQAAEQLNDAIWADGNPFNDGAENAEAAKGVKQSDPSGASEGDSAEVDTGHEPVVYGDGYDTYYPNDRPNMHRDASAEAQKASTGSERRARWNQIVASRTELKNLGDDFFDPDSASDEEFDAMVNLYTRDSKNLGEGGMLMSPYHLNSGLLQGSPGQVCAVDGDCLIPGQTFIYDATVKKINGVFAIRLNSPYTDLDKVNEKLGTSVDFSFLGNREGGQYLDSYVPYNGKPGNNSGVTLATGVDMSQQNSSVLLRSGVPADLVDRLSVAIPFTKQHAVDWNVTNQIHVSPAEAALLDESVAYRYTDEIKSYWDKKRLNSSPDFVDLTSAQQTVLLSRYFNSGFGQLGKHAFFQNAIKGDWSAAAAALRTIDNPSIHDRLMKEANLIDPSP